MTERVWFEYVCTPNRIEQGFPYSFVSLWQKISKDIAYIVIYFRECGAKVEILTAKQIKRKFPWLRTDDIALGCYGYESEGWFDPWALLTGMYVSFILKYLKKLVVIEIYFLFFSHENEV